MAVLIGLGLLYHNQQWLELVLALALLPYFAGMLLGKVFFPPEQ